MTKLTIDPNRKSEFEAKLAKLNRRSVKLGIAPVTASYADRLVKVDDTHSKLVLDIELDGIAPCINGWTLVCRIEHTPAGNLVSGATGCREDLSAWHNAAPRCDHCSTDRARRDTFILRATDGHTIQVGRSCLADFVRSEDAVRIMNAAMWGDFFPPNPEGEGCGFGQMTFATITILEFACAAIRVDGAYRPAASDRSTRNLVDFALLPCRTAERRTEWLSLQPTPVDVKLAAKVQAWAREQSGSDYAHNLAVACSALGESGRVRGILVSAPAAYAKAMGLEASRTKSASVPKITPAAGRYAVTGVVKSKRYQEHQYSDTLKMLIEVTTYEGTWNGWSTVPSSMSVEIGNAVTITATVQPKEPGFAILSRPKAV